MSRGFDPSDFTDNGSFSSNNIIGFAVGIAIFSIFFGLSYFYFGHTNVQIFSRGMINVIAIFITIIEVGIIYYIRNKNKNLAEYSESEYDSAGGCWLLIALLICSFYLNGIFFCEINGRLDFSESTKRKVKLLNKYSEAGSRKTNSLYHYYFVIENWKDGVGNFNLEVSESTYKKFNTNSMIEFETRPGLLGFEHLASEITVAK
jgi:hypothetical protein